MLVKKDIPSQNTESLITEYLVVRRGLSSTKVLPTSVDQESPASEAEKVHDFLEVVGNLREGTVVTHLGKVHHIIKPDSANPSYGTRLISSGPRPECAAQIVLARADEPEHHIAVDALIGRSKDKEGGLEYFLDMRGNPTTVQTGNSDSPVTILDPQTGRIPDFASSAPHVIAATNRVFFEFLEKLYPQITTFDDGLFETATAEAINRGEFAIVRMKLRGFLRVASVRRFLQLLALLFGHTISTPEGIIDLATHLGLGFRMRTNRKTNNVTGLGFEKRHGKNLAYSVEYAETPVAQRSHGNSLTDPKTPLIGENVRVGITIHGRAITEIGKEARRAFNRNRKDAPKFLDDLPAKQFLHGELKQTAWWFERSLRVLTERIVKGVVRRRPLEKWLVPKMINDVLGLPGIVNCTPERLRKLLALDDRVFKEWRASTEFAPVGWEDEPGEFDPVRWARKLAAAAGVAESTVYQRRMVGIREYHVDIRIPYAFYRDLEFFGPHSFTKPENRAALIAAVSDGDGEETLRLLAEASSNFFPQVADVVGKAISSPLTLLPTTLAGDVAAQPDSAVGAVSTGNADADELVTSRKSLPKPSEKVAARLHTPPRLGGKRGIGKAPADEPVTYLKSITVQRLPPLSQEPKSSEKVRAQLHTPARLGGARRTSPPKAKPQVSPPKKKLGGKKPRG
jgi:hypothetical protein